MFQQYFYFTQFTLFLFVLLLFVIIFMVLTNNSHVKYDLNDEDLLKEPPSPYSLPIIGHLHLLAKYNVPYRAFTDLKEKYGDLVKLKLGYVDALIVNGQKNIREILVNKGHLFDSRPNFERYQKLFGGNKENSLAFCDWSVIQKNRRDMLKAHTFPRAFTNKFNNLEVIITENIAILLQEVAAKSNKEFEIKPIILRVCANIFTNHFCSTNFQLNDCDFQEMIRNFDEVFYEVNQGYAADFLPFLMPLHKNNLKRMNKLTEDIRDFILRRIINDRYEKYGNNEPEDYVDNLIQYVKNKYEPEIDWDTALFALEDIIGGHSAVGNFLVKILGYLVNEPEVQRRMQMEIDTVTRQRNVNIFDKNSMPYSESVIFEAIRLIASPIVPRVANQDCVISGYRIKKDTMIFLNNYDLSMSNELWDEAEKFKPERFIKNGRFVKPEHFLPFGGGRRSCMGYKMVQLITFAIITNLLQNYDILPIIRENYSVQVGSLALPTRNTFKFNFAPRNLASSQIK